MKRIVLFVVVALVAAFTALPVAADTRIPVADDAVLFRDQDGSVEIWAPDADDNWNKVIDLTADELNALDETPSTTLLVASSGDITVYKSADGEYAVTNGPDAEGKVRVVIFDSIFMYDHEYEYNVYTAS